MNRRCDQAFTRPDRIFATAPFPASAHSLYLIGCLEAILERIKPILSPFIRRHRHGQRPKLVSAHLNSAQNIWAVLLIVWNIALFVGGLIFLGYFWPIRFMPDMDLGASLTFFIVAALTAGFMLVWVSLTIFYPGLLYYYCFRDVTSRKERVCWFLFPVSVFIVYLYVFCLRARWDASFRATEDHIDVWCIIPFVLLTLFPVLRGIYTTAWKQAGAFAFCFFWASILFFLIISVTPSEPWWLIYVVTASILFFNTLIVGIAPADWRRAIIAIFLFTIPIHLYALPAFLMRQYKWGNFHASSLVLDKSGCAIAIAHGLPGGDPPCRFTDVMILSRLGSTYYVEASKDGKQLRFSIPADAVLSWAVSD